MTAPVGVHVQAVVDHLAGRGIRAGRGVVPEGGGWTGIHGKSPFNPYCIVWRIGAADARPLSLDDATGAEARMLIFVRSFGGTVAEAEDNTDAVRAALLDQTLTVPGRRSVRVWHDNGQTTTKTEDTEVSLFEAGDFFRLSSEPE